MEVNPSDGAAVPTFTMVSAGEVLNYATITTPQIRTRVIKRDIINSWKQQEYVPSVVDEVVGIQSLSAEEVEGCKPRDSAGGVCYLFTLTLTANHIFRLLSTDAAEVFMGNKYCFLCMVPQWL